MPRKQTARPQVAQRGIDTCLWDDRPVYARGLCSACYRAAAREAGGDGKKWAAMEADGLCLPSGKGKANGFLKRLRELNAAKASHGN